MLAKNMILELIRANAARGVNAAEISLATGMHRETVRKNARSLKELGKIKIKRISSTKPQQYFPVDDDDEFEEDELEEEEWSSSAYVDGEEPATGGLSLARRLVEVEEKIEKLKAERKSLIVKLGDRIGES